MTDPKTEKTEGRKFPGELPSAGEKAPEPEKARRSRNTQKNYASQCRKFDSWLSASEGLAEAYAADPDKVLAVYVGALASEGKCPATASAAVAAVAARHSEATGENPRGKRVKAALKGLRRDPETCSRGRGQAKGVKARDADMIARVAENDGRGIVGLRDAALIAVMSDCLLHVCEAAALDCSDIAMEADGTGRVTIRSGKADPEGGSAVFFIGKPTAKRVNRYLAAAGITEGPVFRSARRGGKITERALHTNDVARIIKTRAAEAAEKLGLDADGVRGHSLRIGTSQSLIMAGASLPDLQRAGRWNTPRMPARYTRQVGAGKSAVAKFIYGE